MLKKITFTLAMLTVLGMGASQVMAIEVLDGQACCPSTYKGGTFDVAARWGGSIRCWYYNPASWTTCSQ